MGHDGQMHAHTGVGVCPATPVEDRPEEPAPEPPNLEGYLPTTSFRSRRSALSNAQRQTWERLWPELGIEALPRAPHGQPLDIRAWFGRDAPVVLEIGSGRGTSTLAMAQSEPGIDVIAV